MTEERANPLEEALSRLSRLDEIQNQLAKEMFEAGALYPVDFLAAAALNRSLAQSAGFRSLVAARNLVCAYGVLRMQLDTTLRFHATFLVNQPHELAMAVLRGEPIRRLRDAGGNLMRDAYLVSVLSKDYPWVKDVYEKTSGFVHFSGDHMRSIIRIVDEGQRTFELKIAATDFDLPESAYSEAVVAFAAATELLLHFVRGWVATKTGLSQNPKAAAKDDRP